jgi:signal transduction histidine kinase
VTSLSFRARLALAMSALILAIAATVWFYVPGKLEDEAMSLVSHKAETLAQLTAFTIHPAIYFQDRAALDEALSAARSDKDVAYVLVSDPAGRTLAAFHPDRATGRTGVSADGSLYEVMTPIRDGSHELARLSVGISLARLNGEVRETRIAIGILTAIILAFGLAAVVLLSNVLTRPLREVAAGAERIAAGELDARVPSGRSDEIGQLANAFNDMAGKVAERDASLRQLSKRMLSVQEQERVRIAREVHDELGQALTAMKIDLQQMGRRHAGLDEPLGALARTIDQIVELVRRIASDLRPAILDDLGVTAALEQQLRRVRESTGMKTTLVVDEEPALDMLTSVTLYRIAQEGLANIVRHAEATEVEISLMIRDGAAVLEIGDNGRGVAPEQVADSRSLGLVGMRERASLLGGSVTIHGRPGEGTRITAILPLARDERDSASTLH